MKSSESVTKLSAALVKAQLEMKNPHMDKVNPHFKSKFASLSQVRECVLPILNKHGLTLTQFPKGGEGMAGCVNRLMHESGEWLEEECLLPLDRLNAQGAGSAITYARRYSLQAIAGVVADEDDDGNAASAKPEPKPQSAKSITQSAWDDLSAEDQKWLQDIADGVRVELNERGPEAALAILEEQGLDADHKAALWSRFDSKERSAMKSKKAA